MYTDVVVFAPTDPAKSFFTYLVPKKLSKDITIGQLVLVPWGKKISQGLIIEIKKETQVERPKEILKILSPTPVLLPNYIELLKWMSWYYAAPMLDCLKAMLPELRLSPIAYRLSKRQYKNNDKRQAKADKQTLVLVPTINQISKILNKFNQSKSILIYHKQLPKNEIWKAWWQIYNGEAAKIIGTRSAIFTQSKNLTEIRIINEEDSGFKDERSPYFDTLTVARQLSKLAGARLRIETISPRVETYFKFGKKLVKKSWKFKPQITLINLAELGKISNRSLISDILRYRLEEEVKKQNPILLFLNKIKESGQLYCAECKFQGFSPTIVEFCPNCGGINFRFYSLNLKSVGKEITKFLPEVGLKLVTEGKIETLKSGKPVVTLATTAIFGQDLQKFSAVGIISADAILNLPDFNSSFKTFATLVKLSQLADQAGEVLIQTYNPKHAAIKSAATYDFERFYQEELILRKKLELPPYVTLVKLSLKLKNLEKARLEAEKLALKLQKKTLLVEISAPIQNWQDKPEFNIIVKASKREDLDQIFQFVDPKWKIVVDPESLL